MSRDQFVQITRREKFSQEEFYPMITRMYEEIWLNLLPPQLVTEELPTQISQNVVTPADAPVPDCLTCGACCGALVCVAVSPTDATADEHCWDITTTGERGEIMVDRFLRRSGETLACNNLGGTIGESVGCKIYDERPQMCRILKQAATKCHAMRRAYGIEPFLSLAEMFTAQQKLKARDAGTIPEETIRDVQIAEKPDAEFLEITALMQDGTRQSLHIYDPNSETWRQYLFSGMTLAQARLLIERGVNEQNLY